jgi:hypothetical protein
MKSVSQLCHDRRNNRHLAGLYAQAEQLSQMQQRLEHCLPSLLLGQFQLANYEKGQLFLQVTSSVWASRLRMVIPQIRRCPLYSQHRRLSIKQVHIKVSIQNPIRRRTTARAKALSKDSQALLMRTAEHIDYAPLQQALARLVASSSENGL